MGRAELELWVDTDMNWCLDMEDIREIRNDRTRMACPTGSTLTNSSAETRLHFLENFMERMSPSFPAFLCPCPAPLVCCTLTWLAAVKCEIITELFCAESLFTSGRLILIITTMVTKSVRFRWGSPAGAAAHSFTHRKRGENKNQERCAQMLESEWNWLITSHLLSPWVGVSG